MTEPTDWAVADATGNLLSSPPTDAGYGRDKEESKDASSSASELPSFPRISDDKDNGGRRSPVTYLYTLYKASVHATRGNDMRHEKSRVKYGLRRFSFWATVYKTVRPVLSDRCLSVLSVTLVYCSQTVG